MNKPRESNSRKVMFKRHAHLFTLISVVWTVFTLLAVSQVSGNGTHENRTYLIVIGICVLHVGFIGLSIYFWRTEPESVLMVQVDEGGDEEGKN